MTRRITRRCLAESIPSATVAPRNALPRSLPSMTNTSLLIRKLGVIGLGYIGLPTAALFASRGITVAGFDVAASVVETVNRGGVHIVEPGLDIAVRSAVASGSLRASTQLEACDAFIIAVPTPFRDGHAPDLAFIEAATD